jgi:hypothetical protein
LVHSIITDDSTEGVISRMIDALRKFIREDQEQEEGIAISSVTKRHFQIQIQTLQNAHRDAAKLEQIIIVSTVAPPTKAVGTVPLASAAVV